MDKIDSKPITPTELSTRAYSKQKLATIIEQINEALIAKAKIGHGLTIDENVIEELSLPLRNEVIKQFRSAGWEVIYHNDQRNGLWLQFIPK